MSHHHTYYALMHAYIFMCTYTEVSIISKGMEGKYCGLGTDIGDSTDPKAVVITRGGGVSPPPAPTPLRRPPSPAPILGNSFGEGRCELLGVEFPGAESVTGVAGAECVCVCV